MAGSSPLSTSDLTGIQTTVVSLFPSSCSILRDTQTSDGQGGFTDSWGTIAAGVSCELRAYSSRRGGMEEIMADRPVAMQTWMLYLPAYQDITEKDRVVFGARTFEVASVSAPEDYEAVRLAFLREVTAGV